ncbi:MAG: DUF4922 domain-containing protein [Bacteroidaceae bacterium]|nr:DUF4922 domain-containing protein [Bacteroidaceae bacterium]
MIEKMAKKHIKTVVTGSLLQSTAWFKNVAVEAEGDYLLLVGKDGVLVDEVQLDEMSRAMPADAVMGYSHYRKKIDGNVADAPTIDWQQGSLRNDFDFGPVILLRVEALKRYLELELDEYVYAGFYQLSLAMARLGCIYHHSEYVYTVDEDDTRKSGEKQFDYVNPAQRNVQIEMEKVCTHHLKEVGAWLPPCKYDEIDLCAGDFPVEASVIIPVLNREMTIADAISSVLKQKTAFAFNILVVDNHSADRTPQMIDSFDDERVVHIVPSRRDLGIGGCWELAVNDARCGRFAVQLDSDDIYSDENTLQRIVDGFYEQQCAMLIGSYRICDFELNTLPPGVIDHKEWSEDNGRNNALRINGLGAPRAFFTPVIRQVGFPNVSYGEDYAVGLQISRTYKIGRIYDVLYLCRRWGGNSDAALSHEKVNAHNLYKDSLRSAELAARQALVSAWGCVPGNDIVRFFEKQLQQWPAAAKGVKALGAVCVRDLENGITLQYNPAREVSTAAKVDAASIAARPCFLCAENRPPEQIAGDAMGTLELLVNPYPILPWHFTLPTKKHIPQMLRPMYADMLNLAGRWGELALFYNGAKCGASAPDHAHLQAVRRDGIPLLGVIDNATVVLGEPLCNVGDGCIYNVKGYVVPFFMIVSKTVSCSLGLLERLLAVMPLVDNELEPRMNVIAFCDRNDGFVTIVLPRAKHRPACYYADDESQRVVSPGALDMSGFMVAPRKCDFENITADEAVALLREVAMSQDEADAVVERLKMQQ